jgi:hypothetical protein
MRTPAFSAYFEGAALIGGRPAYLIAQTMRRALEREQRLNGGGTIPTDLAEAIVALERAGAVWLGIQAATELAESPESPQAELLVGCSSAGAPPPQLTSQAVSGLLDVSDRRVRKLAASGELPGRRVHGRWEFDRVHINEYIRNRGTT